MMPLVSDYGDLSAMDNFSRLVDDVCRLVELNPVPWDGVVLDRADVIRRCGERSLVAVHGAVYDICTNAKGATAWCCKSLANIRYIPQIEAYFGDPRYIYLYRDGRDVAVSFRKAVVGEKHFYHIAKEWAATQELALRLQRTIEPGRFYSVSYEELTGDPRTSAQGICEFLDVLFRDSMLDYHRTDEAKRAASSSELWCNVTKPVLHNNVRKFLREAGEQDIRIFESVAGHVLDALGYDRVFAKKGHEMTFTDADIARFDEENARIKEDSRKLVDPADIMRRDLQANLLKDIKARQFSSGRTPSAGSLEEPKDRRPAAM
jgi:hypothetical protein